MRNVLRHAEDMDKRIADLKDLIVELKNVLSVSEQSAHRWEAKAKRIDEDECLGWRFTRSSRVLSKQEIESMISLRETAMYYARAYQNRHMEAREALSEAERALFELKTGHSHLKTYNMVNALASHSENLPQLKVLSCANTRESRQMGHVAHAYIEIEAGGSK